MMAKWYGLAGLVLGLIACGPTSQDDETILREDEKDGGRVQQFVTTPQTLDQALHTPWRIAPERDAARHPVQTLKFFGVDNSDTIVELWPGGGWYSAILAPWLKTGGGQFVAAGFDPKASPFTLRVHQAYTDTFQNRPEIFGDIHIRILSAQNGPLVPAGTADAVLTFRNVHNWLARGYADKVFADAYAALKPGGVFGVVEHRLPSSAQQLPGAPSGYVHEALVIQLAEQAGFVFEKSSEINANPNDTTDHPYGVWTLPPTLRAAPRGSPPDPNFDNTHYKAIGESDRMTLRFRKPKKP